MADEARYAAFISYSSKDAPFAKRLHRALEAYGVPSSLGDFRLIANGKRNRIYPVFRDREELAAGHLGDAIENNLRASSALIVVCSPNAALSPWVQKEIEFFASLGRADRVFAIISDAAPLTDDAGADATRSCFPPTFLGDALAGDKLEPLAADARKGKDGFRNAWLKIVAGLIGVSPGQLIDRDKKRRQTRALSAAAFWIILALAGAGAYSQRVTLEPLVASWTKYRPYVDTAAALAPGATFQDCRDGAADCPLMVVVPEGSFLMGSPEDAPDHALNHAVLDAFSIRGFEGRISDESPQREITLQRYAVSAHEITFAEWNACVANGGCDGYRPQRAGWQNLGDSTFIEGWDGANRPVGHISFEDAQRYVAWLSRMTGVTYRLLSEAEWEYAARGSNAAGAPRSRFSWGDEAPVCEPSAPNGAAQSTCPSSHGSWDVGSFPANAFGLYDMHGNAHEFVDDCYAPYDAPRSDVCERIVLRGGSWYSDLPGLTARDSEKRDYRGSVEMGFRVARSL
ncbi:MAG: SUMF1/EgtB/PvdO family nonheme iron enzyme [Hyphomonadaceae bacterium]|nr:SUMF1/EgtB/PvdO family nonheme iron enzyme [Hyphomonadaceae bacterium]